MKNDKFKTYRLMPVIIPQVASGGTVFSKFAGTAAAGLQFGSKSLLPRGVRLTQLDIANATVETVENNDIRDENLVKEYDTGEITPPTVKFNTNAPIDQSTILEELKEIEVASPLIVLLAIGQLKSTETASSSTTKVYDLIFVAPAVLTEDPTGFSGAAKKTATGSFGFQTTGVWFRGVKSAATTMTVVTTTTSGGATTETISFASTSQTTAD